MPNSVLLDTNLALLFVVGITDQGYIAKHKRLSAYDVKDFEILSNIIARSAGVIFTPNVLSETSNLVRYIGEPIRSQIAIVFANIIRRADERFVESRFAVDRSEHVRLGLTDSVLLTLAASGAALLTDDLGLYLAARAAGLLVINYNHVREEFRPEFR